MRPPQATDTGTGLIGLPTAESSPQRQPAEVMPARWRPAAPLRHGEPAVCGTPHRLCLPLRPRSLTAGRGAVDAGGVYVRSRRWCAGAAGFGFALRTGGLCGSGGGASVVVVAGGGGYIVGNCRPGSKPQ
jgi:hypothetical protein